MKNFKDEVWVSNNKLFCHFAASGCYKKFTIVDYSTNPSYLVECYVQDETEDNYDHKYALMFNGHTIDGFVDKDLANEACRTVIEKVRRCNKRHLWGRRVGLGLSCFAGLVLFSVVLGSVSHNESVRSSEQARSSLPLLPPKLAPVAAATAAYSDNALAQHTSPAATPGRKMPEKVSVDALKKLNGIQIGEGTPQFYVFSDPTCPSCQEVDEPLTALGKPYMVIPIPVRGEKAAIEATKVMCSANKAGAWHQAMNGISVPVETKDKDQLAGCAKKIVENMAAFRSMGLYGTPTAITAKGVPVMFDNAEDVKSVLE